MRFRSFPRAFLASFVATMLGGAGHVTIYRWVQRFTPLLADAVGPCRHAVGDRWFVDETSVRVAGKWRNVYRAVDQYGQIIDLLVSTRRDLRSARRLFAGPLRVHGEPVEVVTDRRCTLIQGYHYTPPLPADDLITWLEH